MYHKVDVIHPSQWWVTVETFKNQLNELSNRRCVYLDEYDPTDPNQYVLTFDDAYENIFRHAFPILVQKNLPFEVFVNAAYIGGWNCWDDTEPLTRFCSLDQLEILAKNGGRIQWHSYSHRLLPALSIQELKSEIEIPDFLVEMFAPPNLKWFAYPYGAHDETVRDLVSKNFSGAVIAGDVTMGCRHQLSRRYVDEYSTFCKRSC
jgi:peptidoglycan/xylan/chitin deacetylase (PgdA/CDA1 family)